MEKYNLEQTGQEVQNILNEATPQSELTAETERAQEAERLLGEGIQQNATDIDSIEGKIPSAATSENKLADKEYVDGKIDDEKNRAQGVEGTLQGNIDAEETRAKAAEKQNADDIDALEAVVPSGATSENKLATESYVNDAMATSSATFRGTFNLVSNLHLTLEATHANIATALAAAIATADNNDFAFVQIPTDADTPTVIGSIERYKFNGTDWAYEYTLNNSGFTQAQWDSINSGITSGDVAKLAALPTNAQLTTLLAGLQSDIDGEETRAKGAEGTLQDNIDAEEARAKAAEKQNADDIDSIEAVIPESASSENKVATKSEIDSLSAAIEAILLLIPSAATSLNKLADKAFVNSSIATATATFRGTYNLVDDLGLTTSATHAQISTALAGAILTANNNDYAFVQIPTSTAMPTEIAKTERYKFNGTAWEYEYDLNNSGFTADQWAAINSGITQALVTKLSDLPTNAQLTTELGTLTSGIITINQKIPNAASQANKLVDTAAMESYIVEVLNVLTISYNVTSTDGHVTLSIEQVDGKITSVSVSTSDIASADALNLKASQEDLTALANRVTTAEGNITTLNGNLTSLTGRVSTNETDIAQLQAAYEALTQSDIIIGALPASGVANKIYRVPGTSSYSDYMWNGTQFVLMATYNNAIDPRPKKASQNLVTSGGVFDNMGALDVSELNATENPHTLAKFVDLSAALAAIPTDYQKGGMSIKFVQSSDNKYMQYRLMSDTFNTTVANWQGENTFVRTYHDITDTNYTTYLPTLKLADLPVNTVTYISAAISSSITDIPNLIDAQIWEVETVSGYSNLSYARTQRAYCPQKGVSYIRHSLNGTSWNTWELMTTPLHSISMYHHIGACGDSFTKGSLYHDGTWMGYRPDLAWCSILARDNGCECTPFALGGANARQFVSNADCLPKLLSSPCQDIYFLFLGINDAISYHSDSTYLGSSSDINVSDPTQNADTFYGNYGKIISAIKSYAPVAQLVMMTVKYKSDYTTELAAINSAIKAVAAIFEIPVIDLAGAFLYNSNIYDGELYGDHPTPMLHAAIAKEVEKLFHTCAIRYRSYFKDYPSSFTNGTYADRPAANTVNNGATYWDSTNSIVWKSNGTDWERLYPEPLTHGATSARPIGVEVGFEYYDETLDMPVYWNGSSWANSLGDADEELLNEEIKVLKMPQSYEVTIGSINASNGIETTATKRLRTSFIKVLNGSKIIVNNRYSKDIRYSLNSYNFRKEIVSSIPFGDFITVGSRDVVTVNNDGYIRLVYQIRGDIDIPSAFISQFPDDLQVLTDENSWGNQDKIDTKIDDDYVVIKPSFALGSLNGNTGAEVSSTTRVRSAFIKVTRKSYLEIVHTLDRWTGFNIYKYDFNKNYIGYDTTYWGSSQSNISKSTIITKIDVEWEGYIRIVAHLYGDVDLTDYVSALEAAYTDYTDIKDFEIKSLNTKGSIYTYPFGRATFIYGNNIGDCIILRTNTNKVIMIDLGDTNSNTDYTMQNKILSALGEQVIDKVIISHYHNDHVSNITKLVEEGNITSHTVFYLPTIPNDFDTIMENMPGNTNVVYRKNQVLGAISNLGCTAIYPSEHDKLILDNITIDFWNCDHSSYYSSTSEYRNYNECSLCCYATIGTNVICFSGDIQTLAVDKYKNLMRKCSIYKANHHAVTAIAPEYSNHFYSGIYPEIVVTTNGRDTWKLISQNSGGLQPFCEANNIPNYVTGLNGDNIEIEFSEGGYMITSVSRRLVWSQEEIPQ